MDKIFFCKLNELPPKKSIIKYFDEIKDELILFENKEGKIKCFSSVCPHAAGEVVYEKCELRCRWHGLKFDIQGKSFNGKVQLYLNEYNVKIIEEKIYVQEK